ncbi:MAG: heavy metal-responsive transcriptional regulator [Acidimicrobiia bacterium]|jgi:DNA-binding transcriptional MerR regulator
MKIGDLGHRAAVPAKTIRYYEEIGLLPEPARAANGYRDYGEGAVERLRFIRDAQASGLSLSEIGSILEMRDHGEQTCDHVIALLERHLVDIDRQIAHLRATRRLLTAITGRAKALDPGECLDPHRCQTISPHPDTGDVPRASGRRLGRLPSIRG